LNYTTLSLSSAIEQELLTRLATDFDALEDDIDSLTVRVYDGDITLQDSIDLHNLFHDENVAGIIVNGNLTVKGSVIDFEPDTYSCFLFVHGSLTCTALAAGCAEIIVQGNITATEVMIAFYNHGVIEVQGDVNSKLLIIDNHGASIKGNINAATFCRGWQITGADYTEWRKVLLPEVAGTLLDEENYLFAGDTRLLHLLQNGQPVFIQNLGKASAANNAEPQLITWEQAKPLLQNLTCEYEEYPFAINERQGYLADARFLLYTGTTVLNELDLDTEEYMGIIVTGDLQINGSIINENTDGACSLIVLGNLRAKNVCVGGQIIYITGYIAVEEMLMGIYNHGELYGKSYVWCPAVIADDYRFYFEDYARVNVLDLYDDEAKAIIKETLIDELFEEEEGYVLYSTIRQGIPLLKQHTQRTDITPGDIAAMLNSPLFGQNNPSIVVADGDWHITINRGGLPDADGDIEPSSVIAINTDRGHYFMWYLSADNTIETLVKHHDEWIAASPEKKAGALQRFSDVQNIIVRKERWNSRYTKEIDKEQLWQLIWIFRNEQTEAEFQMAATVIFNRVLYAAAFPYAYVFVRYKQDADYRGLSESPGWIAASALIDGLIQWGLVQEITRRVPLADKTTELFAMTQYCWGYDCEVDVRYNTQPIDRQFMCELNEVLLPTDSVMVRLDVGIRPYLITGMHVNDIAELTRLLHPYGIFPKYFASVTKEGEASAKQIANALLLLAKHNETAKLNSYRQHQDNLWNYVYNERGDVDFWQDWIEKLERHLTDSAGPAYHDRGEEDADPIDTELDHWLTWCEKYDAIRKQCNIILSDGD